MLVHGMGEQRPLETLRGFVEAVYERQLSLTANDPRDRATDPDGSQRNRVWIVPDVTTGSKELRRITTTGGLNGKRTDFYEFYWADIVHGTAPERVWSWLHGLLLRSPFRVPLRIQIWLAWIMLWALAVVVMLSGYLLADPDTGPFPRWIAAWVELVRDWRVPIAAVAAGVGLLLLAWRIFTDRPLQDVRVTAPVVLLAIAAVVTWLAPLDWFAAPRLWAGLIGAAAGALWLGLVVPYAGDIVRFVRATPATIGDRWRVRERGLALLRAIHAKRTGTGTSSRAEYDRVVVVGHSLGAVVAYDLLQHYWEEVAPSHRDPAAPHADLAAALEDADSFTEALWSPNPPRPFDLGDFRDAQRRLHESLRVHHAGWLVSDFITLGSPLVHSEFLLVDSQSDLERSMEQRMLSASPPRPDLPNTSMLYYAGRTFGPFPHHAAPFAATRWTNIYDDCWFPLGGDVVSGELPDVFGPGIEQHDVTMRHGRVPLIGRFVTHTLYWRNASGTWDDPSPWIVTLRDALDLGRR